MVQLFRLRANPKANRLSMQPALTLTPKAVKSAAMGFETQKRGRVTYWARQAK